MIKDWRRDHILAEIIHTLNIIILKTMTCVLMFIPSRGRLWAMQKTFSCSPKTGLIRHCYTKSHSRRSSPWTPTQEQRGFWGLQHIWYKSVLALIKDTAQWYLRQSNRAADQIQLQWGKRLITFRIKVNLPFFKCNRPDWSFMKCILVSFRDVFNYQVCLGQEQE